MSADNWTKCPKCSKPKGFYVDEVKKQYGKLSQEEYHNLLLKAELKDRNEVERKTLREDFEIGIRDGVFEVNYGAMCSDIQAKKQKFYKGNENIKLCDFSFEYKYREEING